MIDWFYILVLLLSGFILVLQELTIRSQKKLIDMQHKLLGAMIAAVTKAVEEAKSNGSDKAKVEL
jgi:hypothetical protein